MATVLLAVSLDRPWTRDLLDAVTRTAEADCVGVHALTADPEEAEAIIFLDSHQNPRDWRQRALRTHPLVLRHAEKAFVYDERDLPTDSLPGLYVSMPRGRFDERRHRAFAYYFLPNDTRTVADRRPDLLFSFQGRAVGSVRRRVLALADQRGLVEDTSSLDFFTSSPAERVRLAHAQQRYREVMARSKFVLCPRGAGTSSLRFFEALACGRVPVVISDDWVPPQRVDWHSCTIRVPETEVESIPQRLEAAESEWEPMSRAARRVYDDWFGPQVWFHQAVEHCLELKRLGELGLSRRWTQTGLWRSGARQLRGDAARACLALRGRLAGSRGS